MAKYLIRINGAGRQTWGFLILAPTCFLGAIDKLKFIFASINYNPQYSFLNLRNIELKI